MKLHILGSSSKGNSYILEAEKEALLLEAGVKGSEVKKALNFDLDKVVGAVITHEHGDHARYAKDMLAAGIDLYTSAGTIEAMGLSSHRLHPVKHSKLASIGSFSILPFTVKHDAREPLGFVIRQPECGTVLFLTDSYYVEYKFPGLNNLLIECNYAEDILNANLESGKLPEIVRNRVLESHMSLDTLKTMLLANDLRAVNNIVLLHLSDGNSDSFRFKNEIHELTGKYVTIADRNMTIPFDKTPF